jgi:hypothetical protein
MLQQKEYQLRSEKNAVKSYHSTDFGSSDFTLFCFQIYEMGVKYLLRTTKDGGHAGESHMNTAGHNMPRDDRQCLINHYMCRHKYVLPDIIGI